MSNHDKPKMNRKKSLILMIAVLAATIGQGIMTPFARSSFVKGFEQGRNASVSKHQEKNESNLNKDK